MFVELGLGTQKLPLIFHGEGHPPPFLGTGDSWALTGTPIAISSAPVIPAPKKTSFFIQIIVYSSIRRLFMFSALSSYLLSFIQGTPYWDRRYR